MGAKNIVDLSVSRMLKSGKVSDPLRDYRRIEGQKRSRSNADIRDELMRDYEQAQAALTSAINHQVEALKDVDFEALEDYKQLMMTFEDEPEDLDALAKLNKDYQDRIARQDAYQVICDDCDTLAFFISSFLFVFFLKC